jgi:hypothetical protein
MDQSWISEAAYVDMLGGYIAGDLTTQCYIGLIKQTGSPPFWGVLTTLAQVLSQEATFTGYAETPNISWSAVGLDASHRAYSVSSPGVFTTGGGFVGPETIIGWFVQNPTTGRLIMLTIWDAANYIVLNAPGQSIAVVPTLKTLDTSITPG